MVKLSRNWIPNISKLINNIKKTVYTSSRNKKVKSPTTRGGYFYELGYLFSSINYDNS